MIPQAEGRWDLHTHSCRSDGVYEPAELVARAAHAGLAGLALTDHDSVAGVADALTAAGAAGVVVLVGVELSVKDADPATGQVWDDHLLGWFLDPTAEVLRAYLARLQQGRVTMIEETLALLARLDLPLDPARVADLARGAVSTRPHVARALVEAGYVSSEREAFDRYLGTGRPAAPERPLPSAAEAVATIRAAGGVSALAHPVFGQDAGWAERLRGVPRRLDALRETGLQGVECAYPDATPEIAEHLQKWTIERGLVPTGGSDYHGPGKAPEAPLGACAVGSDVVARLRATAPSP